MENIGKELENVSEVAKHVDLPKDADSIISECAVLAENYKTFTIKTQEQYNEAGAVGLRVAERLKQVTAMRKAVCDPVKIAYDKLRAMFTPAEDALTVLKKTLAEKVGTWQREQEIARQAEQRKLDEAKAKEAQELAARAAKAEAAGKVAKAETLKAQAQAVEASAPMAAPAYERKEGVQQRENRSFKVVNKALIPQEYLLTDDVKIGKIVRALGKDAEKSIPGIEVVITYSAAFGGK